MFGDLFDWLFGSSKANRQFENNIAMQKIPSCKSTKKLQKLFKLYHKIKKYFQFTFCVTVHRL